MFYSIYDYPLALTGIVFCIVFIAATWAGIFLVRATILIWIHEDDRTNQMVDTALQSFFALFGLLLGLVAVATYQDFSVASDLVDKEASSIGALYRDFSGYPEPVREDLQERLGTYVRATIENDWPLQRKGIVPEEGTYRVSELSEVLMSFEPGRKSEEILHVEALRQFNHFVEFRRSRLANVTIGLPAVLWWVVAVGALLNIVLIWLQDMEIHVHLILGAILASILALVIFLIAVLDNPFRGAVGIGPEPLELIHDTFMQAKASSARPSR
jgi:hypothetical protein